VVVHRISTISFSLFRAKFKTPCTTRQAPQLPGTTTSDRSRLIVPSFVVKFARRPCGVVAKLAIVTLPNNTGLPWLAHGNGFCTPE
jgi:hypothetical protein